MKNLRLLFGLIVGTLLFSVSCESLDLKPRENGDSPAMKRMKHHHRGPGPGGPGGH